MVVNLLSGVEEQKVVSQVLRRSEQVYLQNTQQSETDLDNARKIFAEVKDQTI